MIDREKVITGLELCTDISQNGCKMFCPYRNEQDETYSGFCEQVLKRDALALLKEQETIVHCRDCKHWAHKSSIFGTCKQEGHYRAAYWFCADGERNDENG